MNDFTQFILLFEGILLLWNIQIVSGEYRTVPKPEEDQFYYFGVHPVVCCPGGYPTKKPIFFPTDPQHEDYVVPSYDYDYEGGADYG